MEIYQTLLDRGYYVSTVSVNATHLHRPSPTLEQLGNPYFCRAVCEANPVLETFLKEADVVVVNGEGTLHHASHASLNLLCFMYAAKHVYGKPVHLINHSLYPSGSQTPDGPVDRAYQRILSSLNSVVPRETQSYAVLERLGVPASQGFDCLPRFIARHQERLALRKNPHNSILVSGGVNMTESSARQIIRVVARSRKPGQSVLYITGAHSQPAGEDNTIYQWMKSEVAELELYTAASMEDWLNTIGSAEALVSGRFHHSLAAAMLETPIIVFPSNTPKINSICDMLGLDKPIAFEDSQLGEKLAQALSLIRSGNRVVIDAGTRDAILTLAEANFNGL